MNRRRAAVMAVAAVALLIVPACGDDDDDGGGLSAAEFRTRANRLCRTVQEETNRQSDALFGTDDKPVAKQPSEEELKKFLADQIELVRALLDDLEELQPPDDDQAAFEEFLAEGREVASRVDELKDDPETLFSEDTPDPGAKYNEMANALGLGDCGDEPEEEG